MKRSKKLFTILGVSTFLVMGASISASAMSSTVAAYANSTFVKGHAYYFVYESSAPKSSYTDQSYLQADGGQRTITFYDNGGGSYQTPVVYGNGGVTTYNGHFQNQHYEITSASSTK
ncbi:hypothetical protein [Clostridium folliculivorans]|uniref:Uncharacterized protein n=1 Tax=Clostridium folliculivorans TaxID=2886038 RepID=A0A9W5Y2U5_9CLOT|nr:hypothetical protein [Clostridium folliculivorans]GKU25422.1 hypothetical protein CFOLD11_22480 [Clostridium folliculivorans]GKU28444.1 hypothetical protein CFB3_05500 [Clostridium folliculivorans]